MSSNIILNTLQKENITQKEIKIILAIMLSIHLCKIKILNKMQNDHQNKIICETFNTKFRQIGNMDNKIIIKKNNMVNNNNNSFYPICKLILMIGFSNLIYYII